MNTYKVVMKNKHTDNEVIKYKRAETPGLCDFMIDNQYGLHYTVVSITEIASIDDERIHGDE